jgi:diguanylate cyclase (GGDEF)-like protein/PAS domain S-box-containing protein
MREITGNSKDLERRDAASTRDLHGIMDGLGPSVFVGLLKTDGRLIYANQAALDAVGITSEEVLGRPFAETPWWASDDVARQNVLEAVRRGANGTGSRFEVLITEVGGKVLTMDFSLHPVFDADGRVAYLVPSAADVTERKQAERARHLIQFAVDHAVDPVFQLAADGCVRYANEAGCRHLGYPPEVLSGMHVHLIVPAIQEGAWPERWRELKARGVLRRETVNRRSDGSEVPVDVSISYIDYQGEEYAFIYVRDISERKAAEERIRHLAHHDPLTELPNRTLLHDRLSQAIHFASRHQARVTVLCIGIDRFRVINDSLSTAHGDEVLREVGRRIAACIRETDTVARISGDEFAVVLLGNPQEGDGYTAVAERIRDALGPSIAAMDQDLLVTCGIGAALYPENGNDADELLKNAGAALHRAKAQGRNTWHVYARESHGRDPERLALEASLREARDRGELRLHYQPRIELHGGKALGVEALVRWQHPEKGMISPGRFIPIAEETGLILPIGDWVLRTACLQMKSWIERGLAAGRIGVNLSARQFRQKALARAIADLVGQTGLDPRHLELELTESMLMQDVDAAIRIMSDLKAIGVHIALDDFGTGYSSLSYLKRFPIDTLKIDQSFVRDITSDAASEAIAGAIIAMAQRLELGVVAEGVETEAQLAVLRGLGCSQVQGYLFCKPLTAEGLTELLPRLGARATGAVA